MVCSPLFVRMTKLSRENHHFSKIHHRTFHGLQTGVGLWLRALFDVKEAVGKGSFTL